jgi:hypothetical protein
LGIKLSLKEINLKFSLFIWKIITAVLWLIFISQSVSFVPRRDNKEKTKIVFKSFQEFMHVYTVPMHSQTLHKFMHVYTVPMHSQTLHSSNGVFFLFFYTYNVIKRRATTCFSLLVFISFGSLSFAFLKCMNRFFVFLRVWEYGFVCIQK